MRKIAVLFVVLAAVGVVFASDDADNNGNVRTTRTSIKVARNVDPDAMETLEVKTRTGDVATIVVKKREGRQRFAAEPPAEREFRLVSSSSSSSNVEQGGGSAGAAVPSPVDVRSDSVYVKGARNGGEVDARSRSLVHVDADGVPVITGVREPDDENDAVQVWRNARVIDGVLVPNQPANGTNQRQQQQQQGVKHEMAPMFNGVWQVYRKKPALEPPQRVDGGGDEDDGDAQKKLAAQASDDPDERRYMTDKILGYIKNINGDVLRAGDRASRAYETRAMQARVLHAPGVAAFPNSAAYSPPAVKASRLSFEQSARTPVLQYAHPELGVQAAAEYEVAAAMQPSRPEEALQAQRDGRRQQALSYFGHDIHADRSPFAFEPGLEKESRVKIPKKYSPPPPPPHYGAYPADKPGRYAVPAGGYYADDEASLSFWTMMKNKMKTSVDKVSDWTKPVVDPLVEATHKITGNLGFGHGNRELTNVVKEKLGMVATPSVLLPALGLVAGGAALGLGAVAVGRYLDYDVVRMRNNGDIVEFQRSLNGSYIPIIIQPEPQENKQIGTETENEKEAGPLKRNKRSIYYKKNRPYGNRKIRKVKLTVKTS